MATELFAIVGFYTGWLSDAGGHCTVTAEFDSNSWYFECEDRSEAERAFYRAAHRAILRKWLRKFNISLPLDEDYD